MAIQRMNVLKDMKYGTRMLCAGDTVDMKGPDVRLYTALGAVRPFPARRTDPVAPKPATAIEPKPKAAPRKRAAPRKKAAKKAK